MLSIKKNHWILGLIISSLFFILSFTAPIQNAEKLIYDWGMTLSSKKASDNISIIAIDDVSLANLGRWPWSRELHATMIDILEKAGAKVIANSIFFLEPQRDAGLDYIDDIINTLHNVENTNALAVIKSQLLTAQQALNVDNLLSKSIADAGNVIIPLYVKPGVIIGKPSAKYQYDFNEISLQNIEDRINAIENGLLPLESTELLLPLNDFEARLGHIVVLPDDDGVVRSETLAFDYFNNFIPSLALTIAAESLNLENSDIELRLGEGVQLGRLFIKTNTRLQMNTHYYQANNGQPAFASDSFYDVLSGQIPASKYKDKIVLIGATAAGLGDTIVTPVDTAMPPIEVLAHITSALLQEDFYISPDWTIWLTLFCYLLISLFLMFIAPRLKASVSFFITFFIAITILVIELTLLLQQAIWLPLFGPVLLLITGYIAISSYGYFLSEKSNLAVNAESAESNRMLGLSFQSQGQLDMAFDKFRRCPADGGLHEILYNLALDFERKRQFNKAVSVYQYISKTDKSFRDIQQRTEDATAADQNVMLSTYAQSSGPGPSLMTHAGGIEKPMLGRYQVESELGKGAMGIVYLGKDPTISRTVAIKTMALSQEFEGEELVTAKERFFREAESAGRLSHPNIVTIFDAGEEQDLAYIAMEFVKGCELTEYTKPADLLPGPTVLELTAKIADALDYAHSMNVVHRDIKPANTLYNEESGLLKITDFGIARITDSSKTKTGTVLGTPTYMAPEQFSGTKVDGRADLFSLGVMLFQLITGDLPFKGDSMATLMYAIANNDAPSAESLCPGLPPCVSETINKALMKDPALRFSNGAEMAKALRNCLASAE